MYMTVKPPPCRPIKHLDRDARLRSINERVVETPGFAPLTGRSRSIGQPESRFDPELGLRDGMAVVLAYEAGLISLGTPADRGDLTDQHPSPGQGRKGLTGVERVALFDAAHRRLGGPIVMWDIPRRRIAAVGHAVRARNARTSPVAGRQAAGQAHRLSFCCL
jgi:hypothetical protein